MLHDRVKIRDWSVILFHGSREPVQTLKALYLFLVAKPRSLQRSPQHT
jgi:hypothetical protein